jgi:hypothetical protein
MHLNYTDAEIAAKAAQLGLVKDGEEPPRHMRGRVVAALAQERSGSQAEVTDPQVAKEIVVQPNGVILVDGEQFPWIVAKAPMDIRLDPDGFSTVRLTLIADAVQILKPASPESENRA